MSSAETHKAILVALAELFFLDTEPMDKEFASVADLLKRNGWTRDQTEEILVKAIAPHAGANLGYGFYLVMGEWMGFDESLYRKIDRSIELRKKWPDWYFLISDWWCRRLLNKLGLKRLLDRI